MFTIFCFSENLLVAAANRFKVFKIFISLKLQYIQDRRLRPEKALDAQGFEWKSNCNEMAKYTYDFKHMFQTEKERKRKTETHTQREQNLAKQFTLNSAEGYSEPSPTSKQGGYLIGGNYFHKSIYLRCLKSF